ncbi:MAG: response regulator transcription factor [Acidimicrobiales bacterium]
MVIDRFQRLSRREQQVLWALMLGYSAREISEQSYVSLPTVRSQIHAVLSKLGVSSQLGAVTLAYRSGWRPTIEPASGGVVADSDNEVPLGLG